ncbi:uncharacterized protein LOC134263679 [Saccostrea cucullata]|uniref:uncharacterized protein LOC134263679 n=1 Tax=Saccostrea cuccullata TaxID=36930 RepID=UPI002ED5DBC8
MLYFLLLVTISLRYLLLTKRRLRAALCMYGDLTPEMPTKPSIGTSIKVMLLVCTRPQDSQSEAWLKIDLGRVFNLKSVRIWYRNDRGAYSTKRLSGCSVLVSNNSGWSVNDTCYQDSGNVTLETVLEVNCFHTAQYVKIYANKNIDGGAILEICELEIYGCSYQDSVGNCISCDQCKNDCMINGECDEQGCKIDSLPPPFCKGILSYMRKKCISVMCKSCILKLLIL